MKEYSKEIHSYGEYITGHLIHLIDYINDDTTLNQEEYNNISKEIELIGKSIDNIYDILQQYNHKMKKYPATYMQELTKDRKKILIRNNKINTIITDNE